MLRRRLVVLAVLAALVVGCAGPRPSVRDPGPRPWPQKSLWRRRLRRNVEPAWEATRTGARVGAFAALLGGLWYLNRLIDDQDDGLDSPCDTP